MNLKIDELLKLQPGLSCLDNVIEGEITVEIHDKGFYINNTYHIKIVVDYESPFFSEVYETKGALKSDYIHKYSNGMLCLSTPIDLKIAESRDCSLVRLYADFIEPYFFSYEFYERFGFFPYEDRKHGLDGVLDSYREITGIEDYVKVYLLLQSISLRNYKYRGHLSCPCGSNCKTRNCHPNIKTLFLDENVVRQAKQDYKHMERVINEHQRETKQ